MIRRFSWPGGCAKFRLQIAKKRCGKSATLRDGKRVKATANGVTSYSVGDSDEVSGGVVKKCNSAGGQRIALRSGGTLYWLLTDHLGGTAVCTFVSERDKIQV